MRKRYIRYNITMAVLSIIIAIILILQLTLELSDEVSFFLTLIDFIIWLIFVVDYIVRLRKSRNKKKFIKKNLIDLVAITPLYSIFKVFNILKILRIGRLARLSELTKVIRVLAIMRRTNKNLSEFMRTNNFNYTLGIAMIIVFSGSIIMSYVEDISVGSAMWWSIVTFTTVGYGDIYPKTSLGRIVASILMIMGIGFIGSVTSTFSAYFIKKEEEKNKLEEKIPNDEIKNKVYISNISDKLNKTEKNKIISAKEENISTYKDEVIKDISNKLKDFDKLSRNEVESICNMLQALKEK
ncbi:MAG: potassium channel family protein [Peptostreptococcaceae bacterium]